MPIYVDQTGRSVEVGQRPSRIVSLVPSQTELICDLGREEALVGITSFCVHPDRVFRSCDRVGGTKNFKTDKIAELNPDLIVANKEENPKAGILELAERFPVWVSDVSDLTTAKEMIEKLGSVLDTEEAATDLLKRLSADHEKRAALRKNKAKPTALYLIWKDPYMAAGTDTFISEMMADTGLENALRSRGEAGLRYPRISKEEIEVLNPDYILLSSEPYPFNQHHADALKAFCRKAAMLVDGEAFSWYGSRPVKCGEYLSSMTEKFLSER